MPRPTIHPDNCCHCCIARFNRLLLLVVSFLVSLPSLAHAVEKKNVGAATTPIKTTAAKTTAAKSQPAPCAPPSDAWLISSRQLGCTKGGFPVSGPALRYWQRVNNQGPWQPRQFGDFLVATQEIRTTWVTIHGNRATSQDAVNYGTKVICSLLPGHKAELPLRTITWSWPSEQVRGLLEDARSKAARTSSESFYIAWLVNQMSAPTPVCFIGHSFGARIGTGAMHLLAGGALYGCALAGYDPTRHLSRGIFTAAAVHNNWLLPNAPHGRALDQAESILFINNSCDPALKRYRFIDRSRPEAIGYCGAMVDAARRHKVKQIDACGSLGKTHDANIIMRAGSLLGTMRQFLPLNWLLPPPSLTTERKPGLLRGIADQFVIDTVQATLVTRSSVENIVSQLAGE